MIDTVKLQTHVPGLARELFRVEKTSQSGVRHDVRWAVRLRHVHVTYYPDSGILYVDFNMQDFLLDPLNDLDQHRVDGIVEIVMTRLVNYFGEAAGRWEFKVQRVDYAINLEVSNVPAVMQSLQGLSLARHKRNVYAESGVNWKSSMRWVKFYDKGKQIGQHVQVLRYEVSVLRRGVAQLCGYLSVGARMEELLRVDVAVYVLMYWLRQLGLLDGVDGRVSTLVRMRELFGQRELASAWLVRECVGRFGTECYKEPLLLCSQSTYYKYLSLLRGHGLLFEDVSLPPIGGLVARKTRNLGCFSETRAGVRDQAGLKKFSEKFSAAPDGLVIWEYLSEQFAVMDRESGETER